MESYSQCGQDLFVINILKKNKGKFLDLGCYLPKNINNTYLLELNGWEGVSIDIVDYSKEWEVRKTPYINENCFNINFDEFLPKHYENKLIDYLSLDMEVVGERYKLLEKILKTGYQFKVVTLEHDSYLGEAFHKNEKLPQRELMNKYGYVLLCSDVSQQAHPNYFYEDWWINPKYVNTEEVKNWFSDKLSCDKIFIKNNVNYLVNEISKKW
jgi:hypothetical protein